MDKRPVGRCAGCYKIIDEIDGFFLSAVYHPGLDILMHGCDERSTPRPDTKCRYIYSKDRYLREYHVKRAGLEHRMPPCRELPEEKWVWLGIVGEHALPEAQRLELIKRIEQSRGKEVNDKELQALAELIEDDYQQADRLFDKICMGLSELAASEGMSLREYLSDTSCCEECPHKPEIMPGD